MKGLSFMPEMLRAFREGRKSVTRRLVKRPRGMSDAQWESAIPHNQGDGGHGVFGSAPYLRVYGDDDARVGERIRCPHGVVGDELWVKEALVRDDEDFLTKYASDGAWVRRDGTIVRWPWKPSKLAAMYCPRWASRDVIEITDVRVERLQDITEEDARAEGVEPDFGNAHTCAGRDYRRSFERLWNDINGRRVPWSSNPWTWVIGFRRSA